MTTPLSGAWQGTVARGGPRRALVEAASGQEWTFAQLDERAKAWAARHLPTGAELARLPVAFALPNGAAWFDVFLALAARGAVGVPLDPGEPPTAVAAIAGQLGGAWWDGGTLHLPSRPRRFRDTEVALIKLTSGSTGRPRPLVFTASQVLADARQVMSTMGITDRDLNYALIPFGHSYGLGNVTVPLLAHGVPVVCGTVGLPQAIAADFARWQPTVFPGVPALWRGLVQTDLPSDALASLRLGISAGAPLAPEVARAFADRFRRPLHAFYGSSETGGIAFDRTGHATLEGGVGTALEGVRLEQGRGQRLVVASAAACSRGRRLRRAGLAAWVMPDRVAWRADGALRLLGRRGAVVKLAGRRVSLAEVEARLRQVPGVRDVWVGIDDAAEPVLGAAVVADAPASELRERLRADTAPWKIPKRLVVVASFPLTARGKVDTAALRRSVFGRP